MAGVHVARKPEMFYLANGDGMVVFPDLWLGEENSGMQIIRSADSSEVLFDLNAADAPVVKDRILLYGRTSPQGELYNGLRPVCYKHSSTAIKPLREVISPSIIYDTKTNVATLWWWTNFLELPETGDDGNYEYTDDPSVLYRIDEETFSETDYVIRALCCSKASVNSYNIEGGESHKPADDGPDMSLVFNYPKIIELRVAPVDGAPSGKGLAIVDFAAGGDDAACAVPENPKDLTYSGEHVEAVRPPEISWNRESDVDFDGVNISISVGEAFHGNNLDCFKMNFLFDACGRLVSISPEEKAVVDSPTKWADCN